MFPNPEVLPGENGFRSENIRTEAARAAHLVLGTKCIRRDQKNSAALKGDPKFKTADGGKEDHTILNVIRVATMVTIGSKVTTKSGNVG